MTLNCISQGLREAEELKRTILSSRDLMSDIDARVARQRLQKVYQQLLILDLEQSLNEKVEHDLWNYGFKNYIGLLQKLLKDRKSPKRAEYQGLWNSCLDSASGFYLILLQEICAAFNVDIPLSCRYRIESIFKINKNENLIENIVKKPEISSCYYICQYCLIHLGDICRYRLRFKQAASFYRSAILLSPQIGQPYNQLALLEAARNNKLSCVFYYIRSVCCKNPFPGSSTNLDIYFQKCQINQTEVQSKLSSSGFILLFLDVHANLHFEQNVSECESCIGLLTSSMTTHIATESFMPSQLVQMTVINIYRYSHYKNTEDIFKTDKKILMRLLVELMAGLLNAFLLPVYTYKEGDNILQYFALPAIKVTLDWLQLNCEVLTESGFVDNLQIWPGFCKLLNSMQPMLKSFDIAKYSNIALPEEQDLQGFLPLSSITTEYGFLQATLDLDTMNKIRAWKLTQFGIWLSNSQHSLIKINVEKDGTKIFEATLNSAQPSSEFILQLEELSLGKYTVANSNGENSSSLSDSSENANIAEFNPINNTGNVNNEHVDNNVAVSSTSSLCTESSSSVNEKRIGILKPPGSYASTKKGLDKNLQNRTGENVVTQTILKRTQEQTQNEQQQQEQKQVTFKTPSPSFSAGSEGSEDCLIPAPLPSTVLHDSGNVTKPPLLSEVGKYSTPQMNMQFNKFYPSQQSAFNSAPSSFPIPVTSDYNSSTLNYQITNFNKQQPHSTSNSFSNNSDFPNLPFHPNGRTMSYNSRNNKTNDNNNNNNSFGANNNPNFNNTMRNGGSALFASNHLSTSQYNNQNMQINQVVQNLIPPWHRDAAITQKPWQDDERSKYPPNITNSTVQPGLDDQNTGLIHRPSSTWHYNQSSPQRQSSQQRQMQDSINMNNSSPWPNFKPIQQQNGVGHPLFGQQSIHSNPMLNLDEDQQQRNMFLPQHSLAPVPPPTFPIQYSGNAYSLFNPTTWNHSDQQPTQTIVPNNVNANSSINVMQQPPPQGGGEHPAGNNSLNILPQQSLWSGPSPLLRLLEQQKQLRTNQPSYQMGNGN